MAINALYEDELAYLRDLGGEFGKANPRLAGFLGRDASDPDVERLLEGFAFLTARLRQRLDDELPELSHSLIRLIWPHYLRPVPPLTILRVEPLPAGPIHPVVLPAGTRMRSRVVDAQSCQFSTCQAVSVLPFGLGDLEIQSRPTSSRLLFRLRAIGKANLTALSGGRLRLFFNTERDPQVGRTLLLWLLRHVRQIEATGEGGRRVTLGGAAARPVGFCDEDAVLPWPGNSFTGFRLLQEYIVYPAKYMFVDIVGLAPLAADDGRSASFVMDFDRPLPAYFRLSEGQIRLNCVPAVNLYDHDADPIRVDRSKTEYRLRPLGGGTTTIHSVESVVGHRQGRSDRRVYEPFDSFRHDMPSEGAEGLSYRERLRPSINGRGIDTYLSFVDRKSQPSGTDAEVVSVKLKCHDGALAERLAVGSIDQATADVPAGLAIANIASVSPEIRPPIGEDLLWRLIANLARNYGGFADVGALRNVVAAYDFQAVHDLQARRRLVLLLDSFVSIHTETRDTVLRGIPARLRHMTLSVDESKIGGEAELFLLGSVLDAFLASWVGINSLHRFAVQGLDSKAAFEWPARFGEAPVR